MASKIDKIIFMQDSEKSQTGKTNVLCSDKRIFVKNKSYQKPQTNREKSLIRSDKGKYSNIDATLARKATPHAFSL